MSEDVITQVDMDGTGLPAPKLKGTDEKVSEITPREEIKGALVSIAVAQDSNSKLTNFIEFTMDTGKTYVLERSEALLRAKSVLDMLQQETGSADAVQMEKDIWMCHETFKRCIESGRANGLSYKSVNIKQFEDQIRHIEKRWSSIPDSIRTSQIRVTGF